MKHMSTALTPAQLAKVNKAMAEPGAHEPLAELGSRKNTGTFGVLQGLRQGLHVRIEHKLSGRVREYAPFDLQRWRGVQ